VGNVIDEAMGNSIRVTVVATGLAQNVKQRMPRIEPKPMTHNKLSIEEDIPSDDEPDVFSSNENRAQVEIMKMSGMEEYDIPSFLRKKGE
jgi:cell division protein FtsZ